MNNIKTSIDCLVQAQVEANKEHIAMEVIQLERTFYESHKHFHGSFKRFITDGRYGEKMLQRYKYIADQITSVFANKYECERELEAPPNHPFFDIMKQYYEAAERLYK